MSRKRSEEAIIAYGERFIAGAVERGVEREVAERVFEQIRGFSGFGFPKAHAAAFGLLAYQSTWLRVHYGPELLCSLLNEQPMGFYPPDSLVARGAATRASRCCLRTSIEATSSARWSHRPSEGASLRCRDRAGLHNRAEGRGEARALVAERGRGGAYATSPTSPRAREQGADGLELLAWAGACEPIGGGARSAPRREDLWRLGVAGRPRDERGRGPTLPPPPDSSRALPASSWTRGSAWSPTTRPRDGARRAPDVAAAA